MTPDEYASLISREMKFIIKWVEARLKKVVPKRPHKHDHSVVMIFFGWDQVQYISNCHREDAAEHMVEILKRWNKMGEVKSDLPLYAKRQDLPADALIDPVAEEVLSLIAEFRIRGFERTWELVLLEEILVRAMRVTAKQGMHSIVLDTIVKSVNERLNKEAN